MGLLVTVEGTGIHGVGSLAGQGGLQTLAHVLAAEAQHGVWVDIDRPGDSGIGQVPSLPATLPVGVLWARRSTRPACLESSLVLGPPTSPDKGCATVP